LLWFQLVHRGGCFLPRVLPCPLRFLLAPVRGNKSHREATERVGQGGGRVLPAGSSATAFVEGVPHRIDQEPIPAQSPLIPADAKIAVGAVAPAAADPIPIVLLPGFEYRIREWRHPDTHDVHWVLERRKGAQYGEDDE
jgi:hypothetical protein